MRRGGVRTTGDSTIAIAPLPEARVQWDFFARAVRAHEHADCVFTRPADPSSGATHVYIYSVRLQHTFTSPQDFSTTHAVSNAPYTEAAWHVRPDMMHGAYALHDVRTGTVRTAAAAGVRPGSRSPCEAIDVALRALRLT